MRLSIACSLGVLVMVFGCDNSKPTNGTDTNTPAAGKTPFQDAPKVATVNVKVTYTGDVPERELVEASSDKFCAAKELYYEDLLVGKGGGIRNVIVSVKDDAFLKKYSFKKPAGVAVVQEGCTYKPHVLAVMVGQDIEVSSKDKTKHNVRVVARKNKIRSNNFTQKQGDKKTIKFKKEEKVILKCEVHSWMSTHIGVFKHTVFAITGADGTAALPKLPAGTYTLEVWHETLGAKEVSVTVEEGKDSVTVEVSFDPEP